MTSKLLPILFGIAMVGMLSFPAHAQTTDLTSQTDISATGIIDSVDILPVEPGATLVTVDVTLEPGFLDGTLQDFGLQVNLNTAAATGNIETLYITPGENRVDGTDTLRAIFDLTTTTMSATAGTEFAVLVFVQIDGALNTDLGTASTNTTVAFEQFCGYDTVENVDYGSLVKGETGFQTFMPSIADPDRYIQPTGVAFTIGAFQLNGTNVVEAQHTSINGTAGPDVPEFTGIEAGTAFALESTMNFVNSNAYITSIGNTITQTTTIAPSCN